MNQRLKHISQTGLMALCILMSSQAFASRATDLVNGTGDGGYILNSGSFFTDDNYNMFYNPAYVNDFKNWGTIEKSNFPGSTAQGGFITSLGNFNVGLYFNRGDFLLGNGMNAGGGNPITTRATTLPAWSLAPLRPVELLFGSDMNGVKWGLSLGYASAITAPATNAPANVTSGNASQYQISLGVAISGIEPFITYAGGHDPVLDHTFIRGGARYHWGDWAPYAAILSAKDTPIGSSTGVKEMNYGVGLGRSSKVADGVKLNYALSVWSIKDSTDGGAPTDATRLTVPVDFSLEGDANSWLTLRAGLGYHLYDRAGLSSGQKDTVADMTTGRVGATVHAGKADVDFAVGKLGIANEGTTGSGEGAAYDNQTLDFGNGFFAAAAFTYHW